MSSFSVCHFCRFCRKAGMTLRSSSENTACFDPKIDNGIYEKATVYLNNTTLRIKCKPGYADKKSHAVAQCENGQWKKLPVCDNTSCGPPPRIPNSVIINKEYSDIFPVETEVFYKCQTGFELHMDTNNSVCSHGQWYPPPFTSKSILSQHLVMSCPVNRCGHIPQINFGSLTIDEGQMFVSYQCDQWFKLKGNSIVRCFNGQWTQPPTCEGIHLVVVLKLALCLPLRQPLKWQAHGGWQEMGCCECWIWLH
uniref:Sushi domain-containing protein n=1 Tax=Periophthalmus magnuspinnatus TaxID=409849 RepID=A0A3B4A3Z9_9GOBI